MGSHAIKGTLTRIGAVVLLLFFLGFAIEAVETPPPNAQVWVDDGAREFISPLYLNSHPQLAQRFTRRLTYGEMRLERYSPERQCNNEACWSQEGRSISGGLLERLGLLPKLRSRWNAKGTWNW